MNLEGEEQVKSTKAHPNRLLAKRVFLLGNPPKPPKWATSPPVFLATRKGNSLLWMVSTHENTQETILSADQTRLWRLMTYLCGRHEPADSQLGSTFYFLMVGTWVCRIKTPQHVWLSLWLHFETMPKKGTINKNTAQSRHWTPSNSLKPCSMGFPLLQAWAHRVNPGSGRDKSALHREAPIGKVFGIGFGFQRQHEDVHAMVPCSEAAVAVLVSRSAKMISMKSWKVNLPALGQPGQFRIHLICAGAGTFCF